MSRKHFLAGLALLSAVFLLVASSRYAPEWFGSPHDDTLYFSSAKSIAEGRGYRIASLPGEPPQTKYPALYPALLSLAWLVEPAFPANLAWAWRLNLVFALAALWGSAWVVRQLGAGRREALGIVAVLAVHPFFVYWSNHLVSDLLFAALALGGAALAHHELTAADGALRPGRWLGAALLLGLACSTRTVGVAFVAGVVVAAGLRRRWAPAAIAGLGGLPVIVGLLRKGTDPALAAKAGAYEGFRQNLTYYTDYVQHWRDSVGSLDILTAQATMAMTETLKHPAVAVFQIPAVGFVSFPVAVLAIAISIGIAAGVVARARAHGAHPLHWAALFYLPIVLLWNYLLMERFWLPFLALLLAGASHELIRIARMTGESWRKSAAADRVVIAAFSSAIALLAGFGGYRTLLQAPRALAAGERPRAELAESKREAYQWLRERAAEDETVISYDDAALYLYTGRKSMRAFSPLTDSFFAQSRELLARDLDRATDTAAALGARYWVASPDDFEMTHAPEEIREHLAEELAATPVAFESRDGRVRVHDVASMAWAARELETRMGQEGRGVR